MPGQPWVASRGGARGTRPGGRPLFNKPLISTGKHKILGREFTKTSSGDFLWHGRAKSKPGVGSQIKSKVKDLFTKDPLKNKYYSNDELIDEANADAAAKGQGGGDGDGGGKKDGKGGASMLGPGLAMGSAALDALDDDPGYGGMDVGKEALKYASMGAAAGPIGAGVGAVVGATIGLIKKKKFAEAEKKEKEKKRRKASSDLNQSLAAQRQDDFYGSQAAAKQAAYTGEDVDAFIEKYSSPQPM